MLPDFIPDTEAVQHSRGIRSKLQPRANLGEFFSLLNHMGRIPCLRSCKRSRESSYATADDEKRDSARMGHAFLYPSGFPTRLKMNLSLTGGKTDHGSAIPSARTEGSR